MMKPGANYRMSRAVKTMLARNWSNPKLSVIRQAAIEGELYGRMVVKTKRNQPGDA